MDKYSVMTTEEESKLGEECGVFGIFGSECEDVAQLTYYGLFAWPMK